MIEVRFTKRSTFTGFWLHEYVEWAYTSKRWKHLVYGEVSRWWEIFYAILHFFKPFTYCYKRVKCSLLWFSFFCYQIWWKSSKFAIFFSTLKLQPLHRMFPHRTKNVWYFVFQMLSSPIKAICSLISIALVSLALDIDM